ncbi:hypothetical protein, partial [Mesorhizobium sp. LSJC280B00]|uniref:hypothetical protein n=1 Tax=Mesorhizobium sp. LSJC280B00 TaxID=1287336 RepID=UPI001AEBBC6B
FACSPAGSQEVDIKTLFLIQALRFSDRKRCARAPTCHGSMLIGPIAKFVGATLTVDARKSD